MTGRTNFTFDSTLDAEAANIALASVVKTLLKDVEVDVERIRQLVGSAADEDARLVARAMWFVQWMTGLYDADGERP